MSSLHAPETYTPIPVRRDQLVGFTKRQTRRAVRPRIRDADVRVGETSLDGSGGDSGHDEYLGGFVSVFIARSLTMLSDKQHTHKSEGKDPPRASSLCVGVALRTRNGGILSDFTVLDGMPAGARYKILERGFFTLRGTK